MRLAPILIAIFLVAACDNPERQRAQTMTGGNYDAGRSAITLHGCGSCHTIPGIRGANALVGPPLTQMGGRMYIAGVMQNTPSGGSPAEKSRLAPSTPAS